ASRPSLCAESNASERNLTSRRGNCRGRFHETENLCTSIGRSGKTVLADSFFGGRRAATMQSCGRGEERQGKTHREALAARSEHERSGPVSALSRRCRALHPKIESALHVFAAKSFHARPPEFPADDRVAGRVLRAGITRAHQHNRCS